MSKDVKIMNDELNKIFPQEDTFLIFVKEGDEEKEAALTNKLEEQEEITDVISYAEAIGGDIPTNMMNTDIVKNFYSNGWTRIIVYYDSDMQAENTYSITEDVRKIVKEFYPRDSYVTGGEAVILDLKKVVTKDNLMVNLIAIIAIFLTILITFRSIILPVILVLTIETAIWINFSIPYWTGTSFMYIGYLIISSVLLGSCVDYAILLTKKYLDERKGKLKKEAIITAVNNNGVAILMSALVLSGAGFLLALTTEGEMIRQIGYLLSRGVILAFFIVLIFLPAALYFLDSPIKKLSIGYQMKGKNEKT
jgi:predicted RND superfamily exporter protein